MSVTVNIRRVPNFIRAASPLGLRRLCLKKNLMDNIEHDYEIVHDGKHWYAWFREEAEIKLKEKNGSLTATIDEKQEKSVAKEKEKVTHA